MYQILYIYCLLSKETTTPQIPNLGQISHFNPPPRPPPVKITGKVGEMSESKRQIIGASGGCFISPTCCSFSKPERLKVDGKFRNFRPL